MHIRLLLATVMLGFSFSLSAQSRISFSGWKTTEFEEKNIVRIIKNFEKLNPDIVVDYRPIEEQYQETIKMKAKSGTLPDVFYVRDLDFQDYSGSGYLLQLNEFLSKNKIQHNLFYPELLSVFTENEKIYGLPKDFNIIGLVINDDHRMNAGLAENSLTDWTELRVWIKKMYAANQSKSKNKNVSGLSLTGNDYEILSFNINHGEFVSSSKTLLLGLGRVKTIIYYLSDFQNDESLKPAFNTVRIADEFGSGQISSMISGIWFFPYINEKYPGMKYKIIPMPNMYVSQPNRSILTTVALGVAKNSVNPDAAFRFIQYFINQFDLNEWKRNGMSYPPLISSLNEIKRLQNDPNGSVNLLKKSGELISLGRWKRSEIIAYTDLVRSMLLYKKNPEMITTEIEKAVNRK